MASSKQTLATAVALATTMVWSGAAHAGPPNSTVLLTRPAGFGPLTAPSVNDSVSSSFASGNVGSGAHAGRRLVGGPSNTNRYAVFVSRSDGLVGDDNDRVDNVYVRDGVNATTTLVSRATDGTPANGHSASPAISSDGRFVVFESYATNLVSGADPNGTSQIYERDLLNGTTSLVSRAPGLAGAIADANAYEPSVSTDGSVIAFTSAATNLGGGSGGKFQVYTRAGTTTKIASVPDGTTTPGTGHSYGPSLSDDGKVVAFTTEATNIGVSDNNNAQDVFVHNVVTGATALASVRTIAPAGAYGNGDSSGASISADGHAVAFTSNAKNLATADAVNDGDVYVHDFNTPATFLASQILGVKANNSSEDASISANGRYVAFLTAATNLPSGNPPADTNGVPDVYVRDTTGPPSATTIFASRCLGGAVLSQPATEAAISPNGALVLFTTGSDGCSPQQDDDFIQVFSHAFGFGVGELATWISRPSGGGDFRSGTNHSAFHGFFRSEDTASALDGDGAVAAFVSESDELSPDDNNSVPNVFTRDARTGATELISRASGAGGAAGNGPSGPRLYGGGGIGITRSSPAAISDNGRYVAFTSSADNLVGADANTHSDVFVRDRVNQTTTLVSVKGDGSQLPQESFDPDISADGNRVAFVSQARLDPAADPSNKPSVYVRDLAAGTTTLASRQTDSAGGADANDDATSPAISGDGNRVAFVTPATNLAPGLVDGNSASDVYVRDLAAGSTSLASTRNATLSAGDLGARAADIDANGTHVAFSSTSTDIVGAADVNGASDVFVHQLGTPTTTLVSQGPGGAAGNDFSGRPSISADGNRIAFETFASDLFAGDTDKVFDVLVRDVAAGTTTLVSRADGAGGALPNSSAGNPSISADGHCVAFDSSADNLVAGPVGTDFARGYLRAIDADCGVAPPGPAPGPAADIVAPALSGLKLSPSRFRVGAKPTAVSARRKAVPKGTKIRFKLSEAATVTLRIERPTAGRKKGKKCVAGRRKAKRCTIYKLQGTLKRSGKAGANSVTFSGRIGKKKLAPGSYRLMATATDAAGNRSAQRRASFKIVR